MNQSSREDHEQVVQDLPWFVNGTLEEASSQRVRAHLQACARCREDYEAQSRVQEVMSAQDSLVFAAEPSYQKLLARIESAAAPDIEVQGCEADSTLQRRARASEPSRREAWRPSRIARPSARKGRERSTRPLRTWLVGGLAAAVVLEAVGLGLGARLWRATPVSEGPYTVQGALTPRADGLRVRAVFRPQTSLADLGSLLRSVGAEIVEGPTQEGGVYTLVFRRAADRGEVDARLAVLRASGDVLFAEPVVGERTH